MYVNKVKIVVIL